MESSGFARPEEADLAVLVLEDTTPASTWLEAVESDLARLDRSRIPVRVYRSRRLRENTAATARVRKLLSRIQARGASAFGSYEQLSTALKGDLSVIHSRLRGSIEEDGFLVTDHREVLAAIHQGSYRKAERLCRAVIKTRPFSPRARYNLACILTRQAEFARNASLKDQLLERAEESLADAVRFGIVRFTRDFVVGEARSQKDAERQILQDPDLKTLFLSRPYLRESIADAKRIRSFTGGGGGCIEAAMPVERPNGGSVPLDGLRESHAVRCWDERLGKPGTGIAHHIRHYVVPQLILIDGRLRLSPLHPVLTVEGWRRAEEIRPADRIVRDDGSTR